MDQVGLPIDKAWTIYQPFIIRRLVRRGMSRMNAVRSTQDRSKAALSEMQAEMRERPVVINRAPVLHKYGVMSFWPQLTQSSVLEVSPLVVVGFNADFDGDAMQFHVPTTKEAVEEAKTKLLPSSNLLSSGKFDVHYVPTMEYVGGLYAATSKRDKSRPPKVYRSVEDAIRAYKQGKINVDREVEIVGS